VDALVDETGYQSGAASDYRKELALDTAKLMAFLQATQPDVVKQLHLEVPVEQQKFLERLQGEITKRGVVDVVRQGIKHGPAAVALYYAIPSA
nr:hypothetical protein [Tanacetum cinerariifolium]